MSLNSNKKLIIWSVIGVLILAILTWVNFFYLPKKLTQNKNKIVDSRVNIELNNQQKLNLSSLAKQLEQIQNSAPQLNQVFFDRTQALKFIEYVEGLSSQFGLEHDLNLKEPSRSTVTNSKVYSIEEGTFNLGLTGRPLNLLNFLKSFEANQSYVLITSLDLHQTNANDSSLVISGIIPWH